MKIQPRPSTLLLSSLSLMLACESSSTGATSLPAGDGGDAKTDPTGPEVALEPASTEAEAEAEPAPAAAAPEPAPVEDKTVLIIGSSLAATGFGALLEDDLEAHPHLDCRRKAKSATGLARPDFYDWTETAAHELEATDPDLVVVVMGGNDGQDLVPKRKGDGARVRWDTEEWKSAYRERVDAFLALLTGPEREVLWLGIPRTNTNKLEAKLRVIRGIQQEAIAAHDRAHYLDLTQYVEGQGGELLKEAQVQGKRRSLRADDGVHFTMSGSRYLVDRVYPEVLAVMGVPLADPAPAQD